MRWKVYWLNYWWDCWCFYLKVGRRLYGWLWDDRDGSKWFRAWLWLEYKEFNCGYFSGIVLWRWFVECVDYCLWWEFFVDCSSLCGNIISVRRRRRCINRRRFRTRIIWKIICNCWRWVFCCYVWVWCFCILWKVNWWWRWIICFGWGCIITFSWRWFTFVNFLFSSRRWCWLLWFRWWIFKVWLRWC